MDYRSLVNKLEAIQSGLLEAEVPAAAEAPADPKAAALQVIQQYIEKGKAPQGNSTYINPTSGKVQYNRDEGMGQATASTMPEDWIQRYDPELAKALAAVPEVITKDKGLFGMDNGITIDPKKVEALKATIAQTAQTAQSNAALLEKLKALLALVDQYIALKAKKSAGQAAKPAAPVKESADIVLSKNEDGSVTVTNLAEGTEEIVPAEAYAMLVQVINDGTPVRAMSSSLLESFGYQVENDTRYFYDNQGMLVEYSMKDFGGDVADTGRGAWNGVTLGAGDNIAAGFKSAFGKDTYAQALAKEKAATAAAEKRSPWLYGGANLAGGIMAPIPGGAAVAGMKGLSTGAKLAAQAGINLGATYAADKALSAHNKKTLGYDPTDPDAVPPKGQGAKPADPRISQLQQAIGAKVDGVWGPESKAKLQAWQQQNGLAADGVPGPQTYAKAGIKESKIMTTKTAAEQYRDLVNRLEMIESEEINLDEYYLGEDGNVYNSLDEQVTDEGVLDGIWKGAKALGRGLVNRTNPTMAKTGNTMIKSTGAEKALNKAGRAVNTAVTKNPGKVALGLGAAGLAASQLGGTDAPGAAAKPAGGKSTASTAPTADAGGDDQELAAIRAQIDALMKELSTSSDPAIQKGLTDIKTKLGDGSTPPPSPTGTQAGSVAPNMAQVNKPEPGNSDPTKGPVDYSITSGMPKAGGPGIKIPTK